MCENILGIGTCCGYIRSADDPLGGRVLDIIRFGSRNVGEAAAKNGKFTKNQIHRIFFNNQITFIIPGVCVVRGIFIYCCAC
jgi:hypothetical protein